MHNCLDCNFFSALIFGKHLATASLLRTTSIASKLNTADSMLWPPYTWRSCLVDQGATMWCLFLLERLNCPRSWKSQCNNYGRKHVLLSKKWCSVLKRSYSGLTFNSYTYHGILVVYQCANRLLLEVVGLPMFTTMFALAQGVVQPLKCMLSTVNCYLSDIMHRLGSKPNFKRRGILGIDVGPTTSWAMGLGRLAATL